MKHDYKKLLPLFLTFFKIGAFTFGGGHAMIPLIQRETVENKKWITDDDILEIIAIAESTPGPVAINSATFVGYRTCGFWGAVCATFGVVLPSFVIIYLISAVLDNFLEFTLIANAFRGIKIGVGILILDAAVTMIKKMHKKVLPRAIMVCSAIAMLCINIFAWNFSSISLMLIAAAVSLAIFCIKSGKMQKGGEQK